MATKTWILGILTLLILTGGVIDIFTNDVRLVVDKTKSSFYVNDSGWVLSGAEYGSLYNGTKVVSKNTTPTTINTVINNVSNNATITRITKFKNSSAIMKDTYSFDGKISDVELFPIEHKIELINASGLTYRYEAKNLVYSGKSLTLPLSQTSMKFGRNMKVEWQPGFKSAKISNATKTLTIEYVIPSNDVIYNIRLFDPATDFITQWNTALTSTGSSSNVNLSLPLYNGGTYNFTVNYGDGNTSTVTTWNSVNATHNYAAAGNYTVTISGILVGFRFNNAGDRLKLINVTQWGNVSLGNLNGYFYGCSNINIIANDTLNLSGTTDLSRMFQTYDLTTTLAPIGNISNWDMSAVTNTSYMFYSTATAWNVSMITWNMSSNTDMSNMFYGVNFNQNLSNWSTGNVVNMSGMFTNTGVLSGGFNGDISTWNTSKVRDMSGMFYNSKYYNKSMANWDVGNVIYFRQFMYHGDTYNQNMSAWNVSNATNMDSMFYYCAAFNQNLSNWNTGKVTTMYNMFRQADSFNGNITNWNTGNVTNFVNMFNSATQTSKFNQNLSWDTHNATNMSYMFFNAHDFNGNITNWNTSNVIDMAEMFDGAHLFNQPLNWSTGKVFNMSGMFGDMEMFNQNLSWNVENVTTMRYMFAQNHLFNGNISAWNTSKVTNMMGVFWFCEKFNQDVSNWNVNKVTTMYKLFNVDFVFNQNLSNWNTGNFTAGTSAAFNIFSSTNLSTNNYDDILLSWANKTQPNTISFDSSAKYSEKGLPGRVHLNSVHSWFMTDAGLTCINNITKPTDPTTYVLGQNYTFTVNNTNCVYVWFTFAGVNQTVTNSSGTFYVNISNLKAGTYNWSWYGDEDSLTQEYSTSALGGTFTVTKATPTINLTINGTDGDINVTGNNLNYTFNGTIVVGDPTYIEMLRNGTHVLNSSSATVLYNETFNLTRVWNFTANYPATENFSAGSESHLLNITIPLTNITFVSEPTNPSLYNSTNAYAFKCNITNDIGNVSFEFNNVNYTNYTVSGVNYTINISPIGAGNYTYKWFASNPEGLYSNITRTFNITKENSTVLLSPDINTNYSRNSIVDFTANCTYCEDGYIEILENGTHLVNNTTGFVSFSKNYTTKGRYLISAHSNATANRTDAYYNITTYILDFTNPNISIVTPNETSYYSRTSQMVLVNISTADDVSVDKIWYSYNGTYNLSNTFYTVPVNVTFDTGNYTLFAYVNDTSGNTNSTSFSFVISNTVSTLLDGLGQDRLYEFNTTANITSRYTGIPGTSNCYQETTNISTACGGLSTGAYNWSGAWYTSPTSSYDGNWDLPGAVPAMGTIANISINYSKPTNATSNSLLQLKYYNASDVVMYWTLITENITIPANCWAQSNLQLKYIGYSNVSGSGWYGFNMTCWNGTNYEVMRNSSCYYPSTFLDACAKLYEEGVWWNVTNSSEDTRTGFDVYILGYGLSYLDHVANSSFMTALIPLENYTAVEIFTGGYTHRYVEFINDLHNDFLFELPTYLDPLEAKLSLSGERRRNPIVTLDGWNANDANVSVNLRGGPISGTLYNNLTVYFNMNESSGTTILGLMNNTNATSNITIINTTGKVGTYAHSFDGARRYTFNTSIVDVNTTYMNGTTISLWFNPAENWNSSYNQTEVLYSNYPFGTIMWNGNPSVRRIECIFANNTSAVTAFIVNTTTYNTGYWNHIVCMLNNTSSGYRAEILLNGTTKTPSTGYIKDYANLNWTNISGYAPTIGENVTYVINATRHPYNGSIDEFSIWMRPITQSEVTELYNSETGISYPFYRNTTNLSLTLMHNYTLATASFEIYSPNATNLNITDCVGTTTSIELSGSGSIYNVAVIGVEACTIFNGSEKKYQFNISGNGTYYIRNVEFEFNELSEYPHNVYIDTGNDRNMDLSIEGEVIGNTVSVLGFSDNSTTATLNNSADVTYNTTLHIKKNSAVATSNYDSFTGQMYVIDYGDAFREDFYNLDNVSSTTLNWSEFWDEIGNNYTSGSWVLGVLESDAITGTGSITTVIPSAQEYESSYSPIHYYLKTDANPWVEVALGNSYALTPGSTITYKIYIESDGVHPSFVDWFKINGLGSYPRDLLVDVGNDGTYEINETGRIDTDLRTINFGVDSLNDYVCSSENCSVPIYVQWTGIGNITFSEIETTYGLTNIDINDVPIYHATQNKLTNYTNNNLINGSTSKQITDFNNTTLYLNISRYVVVSNATLNITGLSRYP